MLKSTFTFRWPNTGTTATRSRGFFLIQLLAARLTLIKRLPVKTSTIITYGKNHYVTINRAAFHYHTSKVALRSSSHRAELSLYFTSSRQSLPCITWAGSKGLTLEKTTTKLSTTCLYV